MLERIWKKLFEGKFQELEIGLNIRNLFGTVIFRVYTYIIRQTQKTEKTWELFELSICLSQLATGRILGQLV